MEKTEIRRKIRAWRKEADPAFLEEASAAICERILRMPAFAEADTVYVYMDCKGEVSTRPLLETAWRLGKKTAAPRVTGPGQMRYYYISSYEDVAPGYYGIPEPVTGREALKERALLIVPGVAFDRMRHRCGYGQGFYDRYLAAHTQHPTIALAFSFQILPEIPSGELDIRPQMVVTEKEVYA